MSRKVCLCVRACRCKINYRVRRQSTSCSSTEPRLHPHGNSKPSPDAGNPTPSYDLHGHWAWATYTYVQTNTHITKQIICKMKSTTISTKCAVSTENSTRAGLTLLVSHQFCTSPWLNGRHLHQSCRNYHNTNVFLSPASTWTAVKPQCLQVISRTNKVLSLPFRHCRHSCPHMKYHCRNTNVLHHNLPPCLSTCSSVHRGQK